MTSGPRVSRPELVAETEHEAGIEAGGTGQFDVLVDGELIFSKQREGRFPASAEIREQLGSAGTTS
jgi:selT/selW/selH-like putative selenoprotein